MPNYKYKCKECQAVEFMELPISSDHSAVYTCLIPFCDGEMTRRMCAPSSVKIGRNTLGNWYKNKTGKELLGGE